MKKFELWFVTREPKRGYWGAYALQFVFVMADSEAAAKRKAGELFGPVSEHSKRAIRSTLSAARVKTDEVFRF